jgi:hypothetical protein
VLLINHWFSKWRFLTCTSLARSEAIVIKRHPNSRGVHFIEVASLLEYIKNERRPLMRTDRPL